MVIDDDGMVRPEDVQVQIGEIKFEESRKRYTPEAMMLATGVGVVMASVSWIAGLVWMFYVAVVAMAGDGELL